MYVCIMNRDQHVCILLLLSLQACGLQKQVSPMSIRKYTEKLI